VPRAVRRPGEAPWPRARKRLGQHFLNDPRVLGDIVDALAPTADDTVVEIGPGRGSLTHLLVGRAGRVSAVEVDRDLADRLRIAYADDPRVTVHTRDVLDVSLAELAGTADFLVAGNVPYYITTPILFHALQAPRARRAVFLVQREVAERVVAAPGSPAYGALSTNVQALATATLVRGVSAGAFTPAPKVDSALIRVVPRPDPVVSDAEQADYAAFVIAAFGMRRKQIRRVLRTMVGITPAAAERALADAGVPPDARPEVLGPAEFASLWKAVGQ
jgi:16S rRNA (adenine1518-N6/adenine1519-N6)-dimethyltransferase